MPPPPPPLPLLLWLYGFTLCGGAAAGAVMRMFWNEGGMGACVF